MQVSSKIEILHEFLSISEITGSLLWSTIEWSPICVRIGEIHFSLDYNLYGDLLTWSWIKNIWNFPYEYGISLPTSHTQLGLHIEGDLFLMEELAHSAFMPRQLKMLNQYQIYLQIHPLSNISKWHRTNLKKVTMMATKINFVNPNTRGLLKDT